MSREIAQAIALITTEYDLTPFSDERVEMWMQALSNFPAGSVMKSVRSHITTNRFKPQLADIVAGCTSQLDGNWPSADEAWALMPKSEDDSAMLTNEMAQAMAAAAPLLEMRDKVAARMAFRDAYNRLVERAKIEGRSPQYFPSFGADGQRRVSMLASAVSAKQITLERATQALPEYAPDLVRMLGVKNHPLLAGPSEADRAKVKAMLMTLKVSA
jgi:hypothetical protein